MPDVKFIAPIAKRADVISYGRWMLGIVVRSVFRTPCLASVGNNLLSGIISSLGVQGVLTDWGVILIIGLCC